MMGFISIKTWICIIISVFLLPLNGIAKTYGWLISTSQNKAQKIDLDVNRIVQTISSSESLRTSVELQNSGNAIVASPMNNLLFVICDKEGRHMGQCVKAYDLKQLLFKKELSIISKDPDNELPKIIIPPIGNNFYLIWWDASKGAKPDTAVTYSIFNKSSLSKTADQSSFPVDIYDKIF